MFGFNTLHVAVSQVTPEKVDAAIQRSKQSPEAVCKQYARTIMQKDIAQNCDGDADNHGDRTLYAVGVIDGKVYNVPTIEGGEVTGTTEQVADGNGVLYAPSNDMLPRPKIEGRGRQSKTLDDLL